MRCNNETTSVEKCPGGAPFDFAGEGFFDSRAAAWASPTFNIAKHGDSLLILALRQFDPASAAALVEVGADLNATNVDNESGISLAWAAYLSLTTGEPAVASQLDAHKAAYEALFDRIKPQMLEYHDGIKAHVRAQLVSIYTAYAPERLDKIDGQLDAFYGKELELLGKVQAKYATA
ncbi:hypothetical protein, variant 1 [Aphanomyces invadans]|uniref:Ankyrin repeat domain-containing protein n=1 Tax=Aphanomyces invadans TaxID=157072 RepID=A0A024TNX3_9STRA|nr:hypothetical protein, variant 1 [Aphanomyces invadans]ETV95042.1 hypothetical protein, variant 1 [Aphanomyces invadans]|eukprot:XP_008876215.1 hypothetical protein, variant 1 [Aphanomyces invadans]